MAASPEEKSGEEDAYLLGWRAINRLMRRGHSWSGHERNVAHLNTADGRFLDASVVAGFAQELDGRALATLDYDRDGDPDLLLTGRQGPRVWLLENRGWGDAETRPRLALLLEGTRSNREAIGARVEARLRDEDRLVVRAVRAGEGFLAQSSRWVFLPFGADELESVEVVWPGGEREAFELPATGGRWRLVEGTGEPVRLGEPGPAEVQGARAIPVPDERHADGPVVLAAPLPVPALPILDSEGRGLSLFGLRPGGLGTGTGRPVVLDLWSVDCAPCLSELRAFAGEAERLRASGVAFLALCVDEDRERAAAVLEELGWPFAWAMATPEALDRLDALHGALLDTDLRLALPTTFFVDADGELRALQRGAIEPERFFEALLLFELSEEELTERALVTPQVGSWWRAPDLSPTFLRGAFARRGLTDAVTEAERMALVVETRSRAEMLHAFARDHAARGEFEAAERALRQALEEDPESIAARFDLGLILQRLGRPHDAIGAYLEVLEGAPDHEDARFNLALAYLQTRQLRSAEAQLEALRERGSPLAEELARILASVREQAAGGASGSGN